MDFTYKKRSNHKLFESLSPQLQLSQVQNYIPLYDSFFALTEGNYASVNLNQPYYLARIKAKESENVFQAEIVLNDKDDPLTGLTGQTLALQQQRPVFFKYSPLLDPIKYLMGKYDARDPNLLALPTFPLSKAVSHPKVLDVNNLAYVDSFFTYLTSQLLHRHGFQHGVDFFGSYLAQKHDFAVNVYDDIEYLQESTFFKEHYDSLFRFDEADDKDLLFNGANGGSRSQQKRKLCIAHDDDDNSEPLQVVEDLLAVDIVYEVEPQPVASCDDLCAIDLVEEGSLAPLAPLAPEPIQEALPTEKQRASRLSSTSSSCSSRSSNTDNEDVDMEDVNNMQNLSISDNQPPAIENDDNMEIDGDGDGDDDDDDDDYSTIDGSDGAAEDKLLVRIHTFPVQVIALECCTDTLDALLLQVADDLKDSEWAALVMQILMMLITYQHVFGLTHNDLHTNNIMYVETDQPFLYYKVAADRFYKVPTYGRLFKIIDFGRAIYKFRGQTLCSDSYDPLHGDAATQYNCEPYMNPAKPRLDPNPSFDLCRLGCALFDFLVDDISDTKKVMAASPIKAVMLGWCFDDKGRNIIYKNNGEERYPDFKLYKMIARTVHNHVPAEVLRNNAVFDQFLVGKKKVKLLKEQFMAGEVAVMDLTALPSYQ
jgi:hypothetical protein